MKSRILTLIVTLLALGLALAACVALPYEQPVFEQSRTVGGGVSVNSLTANSIETTDLSADSIATTDLDASGNVIVTGTITGTTFASGPLEMGSIEVFDGGNVLSVGLRGNPGGGLPPVRGDQAYIQMTQAMTDTDGGVLDILGQQGGPASANDGLKGGTIRITGGMGSQLGEGGASSGNGGVVLISGGAKGENGEGAAIDGYVSIGGGWPSEIITPTTDGLFVGGPSEFNDDLLVDGDLTVNGTCTGCGGGSASYLVYTAILTQITETVPSALVLENTLGVTPVWSRLNPGQYALTYDSGNGTGPFVQSRTVCFLGDANTGYQFECHPAAENGVSMIVNSYRIAVDGGEWASIVGEAVDGAFLNYAIEIRVYPAP